jgi:peptide/histidine transporter 3/4
MKKPPQIIYEYSRGHDYVMFAHMQAGSMLGLGMAIDGTSTNQQVYLLKEYNVESIDAAQIANIVRGSLNLVPIAGAVVSDSYFGCFRVVLAGTAINVPVGGYIASWIRMILPTANYNFLG